MGFVVFNLEHEGRVVAHLGVVRRKGLCYGEGIQRVCVCNADLYNILCYDCCRSLVKGRGDGVVFQLRA